MTEPGKSTKTAICDCGHTKVTRNNACPVHGDAAPLCDSACGPAVSTWHVATCPNAPVWLSGKDAETSQSHHRSCPKHPDWSESDLVDWDLPCNCNLDSLVAAIREWSEARRARGALNEYHPAGVRLNAAEAVLHNIARGSK